MPVPSGWLNYFLRLSEKMQTDRINALDGDRGPCFSLDRRSDAYALLVAVST